MTSYAHPVDARDDQDEDEHGETARDPEQLFAPALLLRLLLLRVLGPTGGSTSLLMPGLAGVRLVGGGAGTLLAVLLAAPAVGVGFAVGVVVGGRGRVGVGVRVGCFVAFALWVASRSSADSKSE